MFVLLSSHSIQKSSCSAFKFKKMDFTPDLTALQGVLISTDNVHTFSQLSAKGGNEEKIKYVIESVRQFLNKLNNDSNEVEIRLRKFALFLVLNADFAVLNEMVEIEGIDFVIWTIPTIPKCLLCELLWNLDLGKYVQEIISFCAPELALQLADALITYIKYMTPKDCLPKLQIICEGILMNICRLHFFNYTTEKTLEMLMNMYNSFQKCLKYYSDPPNPGKLEIWDKDEKYKLKGQTLHTFLNVISKALKLYTGTIDFDLGKDFQIYIFTYNKDHVAKERLQIDISDTPNITILEHLDMCNAALMDMCEVLVMDVSVDIWCAWSEFEDNGNNMQQTIGELCYKLREKLLTVNTLLDHPVVSMMKQIARKPADIVDIVNTTDTETIINYITHNGEHKIQWLHALVNRNNIEEDTPLMEQLISNIELLNDQEHQKLYQKLYDSIKINSPNKDKQNLWLLKIFEKCCLPTKQMFLNEHFCDNKLSDVLQTAEFTEMMTITFNKLVASSQANLTDILSIFLQSPVQVYNKIFDVAIENAHQRSIMIDVIKMLNEFKNHYYNSDMEPCIVKVTINKLDSVFDTDEKIMNLLQFVCSLKTTDVIPATKLLLLIIMPKLHMALIGKNIRNINSQCKLLHDGYRIEELITYRAPLLAMYAQIMNVVRWRIDTYNHLMPPTLQLVIDLQTALINSYENIPDTKNESVWLISKLRNLEPLNMYYYKLLWNPPGKNYVEIITGKSVSDKMDIQHLTAWLSQVLCATTEQEWYHIWDSLNNYNIALLNIIHDALCLITMAQGDNQSDSSWACILNSYTNFVYLVRYKYLTVPVTEEQVQSVMNKIIITANLMKEDNVGEFGSVLIPLFVYLKERKQDYSIDISSVLHTKVKQVNFLNVVSKVLQTGE